MEHGEIDCNGLQFFHQQVLNLKVGDIDSDRMKVHIRLAKGQKDRFVFLPAVTLDQTEAVINRLVNRLQLKLDGEA